MTREAADRLLRRVVAEHCGVREADVGVTRACPRCASSEHGRPVALLPSAATSAPRVSLSRAGDLLVAVATDAGPVGVDLERVPERPVAGFAEFALHPDERAPTAVAQVRVWTRKEALLKATGDGLHVDPRTVRVTAYDRSAGVIVWPGGALPATWLWEPAVAGHAACVALLTEEEEPRVTLRWAGPGAPARPATR